MGGSSFEPRSISATKRLGWIFDAAGWSALSSSRLLARVMATNKQAAFLVDGEIGRRLLLEQLDRQQPLLLARVRELTLDETRHGDCLVLEALGLVDGHQLHALDLDPADLVRVEVSADLLVHVQVGHELAKALARVRLLPGGDEAHQPRHGKHGPLRVRRFDGDQIVKHVRPDEELLEDRERAVALAARHELVEQRHQPLELDAQARVELLPPPLGALVATAPLADGLRLTVVELLLRPERLNRDRRVRRSISESRRGWLGNRDLALAQDVRRCLVDGPAVPGGGVGHAQDLGRVEPPRTGRQEAHEGARVVRVGGDAQRGLDVAHLRHGKQARAADDDVRDVLLAQPLDDQVAVAVLAVEHRDVAPALGRRQLRECVLDPGHDHVRLVLLVSGVDDLDRLAERLDGSQRAALEPLLVAVDQPAGRRQDVAGGAAVVEQTAAARRSLPADPAPTPAACRIGRRTARNAA